MPLWFFASDLHGHVGRYNTLFDRIAQERPQAVLLGGDLLPGGASWSDADGSGPTDFLGDFLARHLVRLREALGDAYPRIIVILGNDDPKSFVPDVERIAAEGLWDYAHQAGIDLPGGMVWGYSCTPPSPFLNKDWERYDVSRYVDPGSVSPEEGFRSVPQDESDTRYGTIADDLETLFGSAPLGDAVVLFHAPPYQTVLDRAALDGRIIDHVQVDVHVGSVAIKRFIKQRQPRVTLHGHIHESARITGAWRERIGRTWCIGAAHDGPELALVRLDPEAPGDATRMLIG